MQQEVQNYSIGKQTPMSPHARQGHALEKITLMTLKARGKLRPGQPTAKQFAEMLRQERADIIPDQYGEDSNAFIHNSTAKPITAYRFNKFKDMHKMRGINLDKTTLQDPALAEKMRKKRSMARHDKSSHDKFGSNMINYKNQGVDFFTGGDDEALQGTTSGGGKIADTQTKEAVRPPGDIRTDSEDDETGGESAEKDPEGKKAAQAKYDQHPHLAR